MNSRENVTGRWEELVGRAARSGAPLLTCYHRSERHQEDMITPPADLHSHHNEGDRVALFLIVQDGGLYYHCRTMGFSYA